MIVIGYVERISGGPGASGTSNPRGQIDNFRDDFAVERCEAGLAQHSQLNRRTFTAA